MSAPAAPVAPGTGAPAAGQQTANPAGQDPAEGLETGDQGPKVEFSAEQQAHLDQILKKRLEREREKWAEEVTKAETKARREAEEAKLAEQQQFQQLATRRQQTIEEQAAELSRLGEVESKVKKYEKALAVYRDQMIASVPEPVKELLKGQDVADQLSWLAQYAQQLAQSGQPGQPGPQPQYFGPPPAPGAKGPNGQLAHEAKLKKAYKPQM